MGHEVRKLVLFEPLFYSREASDGGDSMTKFTTRVSAKSMDPAPQDYLADAVFCGYSAEGGAAGAEQLPKGTYAFVQWTASSGEKAEAAAEALWLECVWQEFQPEDSTLYLRELRHGSDTVYQLFRKIASSES